MVHQIAPPDFSIAHSSASHHLNSFVLCNPTDIGAYYMLRERTCVCRMCIISINNKSYLPPVCFFQSQESFTKIAAKYFNIYNKRSFDS